VRCESQIFDLRQPARPNIPIGMNSMTLLETINAENASLTNFRIFLKGNAETNAKPFGFV
jgi:hypothetical protein